MTINDFYQTLAFPETARLGARIYKKQIVENAELTSSDRKLLAEQVETLEWRYALKPSNCAIGRYDDEEREYGEIALLHICLKSLVQATQLKRLGELLQRAIPYPLLIVFESPNDLANDQHEQIAFCMADKRLNRADASKLVTVKTFDTMWLCLENLSAVEQAFLLDFSLAKCNQQNLYAVYGDLTRSIVALEIGRRTNSYQRSISVQIDQQRQDILQEIRRLEQQLASKQVALKSEIQFNRQLELNMSIKQIRQELAEYTAQVLAPVLINE